MPITKEEQTVMQEFIKNNPELVQKWIDEKLESVIDDVHKFEAAHRSIVEEYINNGLLPAYTNNFININKQFCTLGINGHLNAAKYLGYDIESANEDYMDWIGHLMKMFKDKNKQARKIYHIKYNTEIVPSL